ncbi:hypothetical protein D0T84_16480 [Dysgonomonas sp. 521]|uniref:hypothetical protein n=1 Tax=Dysgonomonas sp. 521 TaxID=2302932 RepID=UPI0013D44943|nr:hypothetical protein [Dysgonomonas sp. 521]NDV96498.1 hypothetical protein [Dysgonomonas sp. 521]
MKNIFVAFLLVILSFGCKSQTNTIKVQPGDIIGCWDGGSPVFVNQLYLFDDGQFLYSTGYSGGAYHIENYKGEYIYNPFAGRVDLFYTHRSLNSCMKDTFAHQPQNMVNDFRIMDKNTISGVGATNTIPASVTANSVLQRKKAEAGLMQNTYDYHFTDSLIRWKPILPETAYPDIENEEWCSNETGMTGGLFDTIVFFDKSFSRNTVYSGGTLYEERQNGGYKYDKDKMELNLALSPVFPSLALGHTPPHAMGRLPEIRIENQRLKIKHLTDTTVDVVFVPESGAGILKQARHSGSRRYVRKSLGSGYEQTTQPDVYSEVWTRNDGRFSSQLIFLGDSTYVTSDSPVKPPLGGIGFTTPRLNKYRVDDKKGKMVELDSYLGLFANNLDKYRLLITVLTDTTVTVMAPYSKPVVYQRKLDRACEFTIGNERWGWSQGNPTSVIFDTFTFSEDGTYKQENGYSGGVYQVNSVKGTYILDKERKELKLFNNNNPDTEDYTLLKIRQLTKDIVVMEQILVSAGVDSVLGQKVYYRDMKEKDH